MKSKEIIFYPKSKLVKNIVPPPKPTSIPEWFKKIPPYQNTFLNNPNFPNNKLIVENGESNLSVKSCIPFLESLSSGYSFNLWADVYVRQTEDGPRITWIQGNEELKQVNPRPDPGIPVHSGFEPLIFSWWTHWGIKTPKGYSSLFTHPFNRSDLPFITTTGIIDTDNFGVWGNYPFSLQKNFEGLIPAGTPIVNVFPFKRDSWMSKIDESLSEWGNIEDLKKTSKIKSYYKNNFWQKKKYY